MARGASQEGDAAMKVPQMPRMWMCIDTPESRGPGVFTMVKRGARMERIVIDGDPGPSMPHRANPIAPVSLRREIAALAARMMAEDGIQDYGFAKAQRQPANWVPPEADSLPTNAEIEAELRAWQAIYQDEEHAERLVEMRRAAIEVMRLLAEFRPYLTGAVLDGTAGRYSEVDIEIYSESAKDVEIFFLNRDLRYEHREPRRAAPDAAEAVLVFDWNEGADPGFDLRAQCDRHSRRSTERIRLPGVEALLQPQSQATPMKPLHQTLLVIAVAAGAGAAGYLFNHSMSASADRTAQPGSYISSAAGAKIFALELTDIAGEKQSLEQWRGKIMVVNFWATWCPPCLEIPDFSRVSRRFENRGTIRRRQHRYAGKRRPLPEGIRCALSTPDRQYRKPSLRRRDRKRCHGLAVYRDTRRRRQHPSREAGHPEGIGTRGKTHRIAAKLSGDLDKRRHFAANFHDHA